jgi:hypothetical protein
MKLFPVGCEIFKNNFRGCQQSMFENLNLVFGPWTRVNDLGSREIKKFYSPTSQLIEKHGSKDVQFEFKLRSIVKKLHV